LREMVEEKIETRYVEPEGLGSEHLSILDLLLMVARRQTLVVRVTAASVIVTAIASFLLPNIYTATAKVVPPQQNQSTVAMLLGEFGALGNLAGVNLQNPNDLYVAMLRSRTVEDAIVSRFELQKVYSEKYFSEARLRLEDVTDVSTGVDGVITINVDDEEPQRAAKMANAYVEELIKVNQGLAISGASQRRQFFEKQLFKAKEDLAGAEAKLRATQESTGLIDIDSQAKAIIEAFAVVKGQIATKEVELQSMSGFATERNPDYIRTRNELAALRGQLASLERRQKGGQGDLQIATAHLPAVGLEYVNRMRDVKYYETIYGAVAKQYELARLDEANNTPVVQVLDQAVTPDKKSKPKRLLLIIVAAMVGFSLSVAWIVVSEFLGQMTSQPDNAGKVTALKHQLGLLRTQFRFRRVR
jgi:tyrosine-protein kinase Etk/Wzc